MLTSLLCIITFDLLLYIFHLKVESYANQICENITLFLYLHIEQKGRQISNTVRAYLHLFHVLWHQSNWNTNGEMLIVLVDSPKLISPKKGVPSKTSNLALGAKHNGMLIMKEWFEWEHYLLR